MQSFDIVIVGAGIVGAATAWELIKRHPEARICVVEKEASPASHQTGRNSGVIHAGVYYAPGSLKAQYCREGLEQTIAFCQAQSLPYEQCGKLLVATSTAELKRMEELYRRCEENGLSPVILDKQELSRREPNICGEGAIFVSQTGITDYRAIAQRLLALFQEQGGEVHFGAPVTGLNETDHGVDVLLGRTEVKARFLVNCAGLHSDTLIRKMGLECDFQIVPFRGEYFRVRPSGVPLINHLIYPIPDPALPFLGVHLTKMIDGSVTVGPNAVLAMAREGYHKSTLNLSDMFSLLRFKGTLPLLKRYGRSGLTELKNSFYKPGYTGLVQKYCPSIRSEDLLPYKSGVRAQAVTNDGTLLHDFAFVKSEFSLHIGNAPSPAATSAMPIASHVADLVEPKL